MSAYNLTNTNGHFVRAYHANGDVTDRCLRDRDGAPIRNDDECKREAQMASRMLQGEVCACKGASVIASYREGREV